MTSNIGEFNIALDRFLGRQIPEVAVAAHKKLSLDALTGVVRKSPVDTGRFRGNWHLSLLPTAAPTNTVDRLPRGSDPSGDSVVRGLSALSALPPYSITYLANNLPYAQRLENGWSDQAPQGMVALTVAELQDAIIDGGTL